MFDSDILCAAAVVGGVAALSLLSNMAGRGSSSSHSSEVVRRCKDLVAQANENYKMGEQCESPLFALRFATFAVSYMNAARILASDDAIQKHTGIDVHETVRAYESMQRKMVAKVGKACPASAPKKHQAPPTVTWL